jgi:hypothetical protein
VRRALPAIALLSAALFTALSARAQDGAAVETIDASHVKVGQRYSFKLAAGNRSTWEITAKTDEEIAYRIQLVVAGKELEASTQTHAFPLVRKLAADDRRPKKVRDEELTVSGVKFPCTVTEIETGGTTVRTWRSTRFPETIKVEMGGKDVTAELVEISYPR